MNGINYAIDNINAGYPAMSASGTAADELPYAERNAFRAEVDLVADLTSLQHLAISRILNGSANYGDAAELPAPVVAALRARSRDLDYVLTLVDEGKAQPFLPPYEW